MCSLCYKIFYGHSDRLADTKFNGFVVTALLFSSPSQNLSEEVCDPFILRDPVITNIHSRRNEPPLSLIMTNVAYLIRETFDITLRNLLKQDLN